MKKKMKEWNLEWMLNVGMEGKLSIALEPIKGYEK